MILGVFWLIKLILDFFYMFKWQDYAVGAIAIILFIYAVCCYYFNRDSLIIKKSMYPTIVVLIICFALTTVNFFLNISFEAFKNYAAIVSSLLIFVSSFIISGTSKGGAKRTLEHRYNLGFFNIVFVSYSVIYIANIVSCIEGYGLHIWQGATVMRGLYFNKSDLALFILQYTVILLAYFSKQTRCFNTKIKVIFNTVFIINAVWLLMINTRMTVLIYFFLAPILFRQIYYNSEETESIDNKWVVRKIPICIISLIIGTITIVIFANIANIIGRYIVFDSNKISSYYSDNSHDNDNLIHYNVQGFKLDFQNILDANSNSKSTVALKLIKYYLNEFTIEQKIIGLDLKSVNDNELYYPNTIGGCHNMYLEILYFNGIIGIIAWGLWILYILYKLINSKSQYSLSTICMIIIMLFYGFSKQMYTESQHTWLVMILIALFLSDENIKDGTCDNVCIDDNT